MRKLARDLKAVHQALDYKATDILPIEQVQRDKLKYRKKLMLDGALCQALYKS